MEERKKAHTYTFMREKNNNNKKNEWNKVLKEKKKRKTKLTENGIQREEGRDRKTISHFYFSSC